MSTTPRCRIDVKVHTLLMDSLSEGPEPLVTQGLTLPEPVYPRFPEKLSNPGPEAPPENRNWTLPQVYHKVKGWLFPYIRSRVLPGEFHPITAYLFAEGLPIVLGAEVGTGRGNLFPPFSRAA